MYVLFHLIFVLFAIISPQCMTVPNRPQKLYFLKYHMDYSGDQIKEDEMCVVRGMHGIEKKCT
jgi:hypothetical protein